MTTFLRWSFFRSGDHFSGQVGVEFSLVSEKRGWSKYCTRYSLWRNKKYFGGVRHSPEKNKKYWGSSLAATVRQRFRKKTQNMRIEPCAWVLYKKFWRLRRAVLSSVKIFGACGGLFFWQFVFVSWAICWGNKLKLPSNTFFLNFCRRLRRASFLAEYCVYFYSQHSWSLRMSSCI